MTMDSLRFCSRTSTIVCAIAALLTHSASASERHPISITEAQMFVTRTKAITRIQIFAEDLVLFQALEPNDQDRITPADLKKGLEDHKAFLLEKYSLRNAAGDVIKGQLTDMKPFDIPPDGIPSGEMMMHTAMYEIEHSFPEPPEFLTIQQDITDENFIIPSEMSLHVHQSGTGLNYTERLLPGASTTVRFDWENALADNASDQEWESWFEKQREKTLGITSYSSVYSFIYIEPAEVRHEILIPLATLGTIIPLEHADPAFIEVAEQDAIREGIRKWLRDENPVLINGTRVIPEFSRIDFYSLNLSDFATQAAPQKVSMASGRVGIIMNYRTLDDSVRDVSLVWNLYYSGMNKIPAVVISYPNKMDRFEFSKFKTAEQNTLSWKCPPDALPTPVQAVAAPSLRKPMLLIPIGSALAVVIGAALIVYVPGRGIKATVASLMLLAVIFHKPLSIKTENPFVAPPELTTEEAAAAFKALHSGMYRSLDFGSEDRIYDVLATTVDGPLLEDLYLQLRQSLEVREQGGAVARIRKITQDSGSVVPRDKTQVAWPGFEYQATWTVAGTVEHWGHIHERQNQFEATFTIEPKNGEWKFTRMDIAGQKQKSARTTLRKF
ncbi:MAG: hypothetical protein U0996_03025 [Planctomycetaceae bacterium]